MDNTYECKIQQRRELIDKHPGDTIGFNPVARDAVKELYEWLFSTYLPKRFPDVFVVEETRSEKRASRSTRNLNTQEVISHLAPEPKECLRTIGRHVDCEFALLLPVADPNASPVRAEPTMDPKEVFHLHAFILAFPSGFTPARKLGLPLAGEYCPSMVPADSTEMIAGIHGPVPGYSTKLEKSMDRYFTNLPFGKVVQRANWSISTDSVLFKLGEMHTDIRTSDDGESGQAKPINSIPSQAIEMAPAMYTPSEEELAKWKAASKLIDPSKCSLRMERQTLHRLEKTGALIFGFKTFMEPLSELKKEGSGQALANALNGLNSGTVPAMDVYKDGVIWREPLVEYLTS
jgi:hypothetical protein